MRGMRTMSRSFDVTICCRGKLRDTLPGVFEGVLSRLRDRCEPSTLVSTDVFLHNLGLPRTVADDTQVDRREACEKASQASDPTEEQVSHQPARLNSSTVSASLLSPVT